MERERAARDSIGRRVVRGATAHGRVWLGFSVLVVIACAGTWQAVAPEGRHRIDVVTGAGEYLGSEACLECHESFAAHEMPAPTHADCESCHGAGQLHVHTVQAEAIRFPSNGDCESCHAPASRTLSHWPSSPHAEAGVMCSDCHAPHARELNGLRAPRELDVALLRHAGDSTRLCASCHSDVVAELSLPSHHPVKEGMLACTDCHSPHAADDAGAGLRTDACSSCHQEVMGPWVFDHAPVSEDCGTCHVPHGAVADSLLETSEPAVCISCHTLAEAGAVHDPWALQTACSDCHGAVHGSFTDPHLRR